MNALSGEEIMKVNQIREDDSKGGHERDLEDVEELLKAAGSATAGTRRAGLCSERRLNRALTAKVE